jgi:MarR family transcriptional regulator, lower aerobic nicotinate degradation pathway regulator
MRGSAHRPRPGKGDAAPGTYVLEQQVGFLLRCAHQRASEVFHAVMAPFAVTPTQFAALAKIDDLGSVSQNQLGRLTAMDPATISGVIGRLTARGLVRQSRSRRDARLLRLALTAAGRTATARMKAAAGEVSRRTLEPLGPARSQALLRALTQIG